MSSELLISGKFSRHNIYNKQTIANMITSKNFLDATLQGCRLMPRTP